MKVKLTWFAMILISVSLLVLAWQAKGFFVADAKEGFIDSGQSDIAITTCPAKTQKGFDNDGKAICCKPGDLVDGKCTRENTLCSLNENVPGMPTCSEWYTSYLAQKAALSCPPSLPNYFEGAGGQRGCTAGPRNKDGSSPADPKAKFCRLYDTKDEDNANRNSCQNTILLDSARCLIGENPRLVLPTKDGKVRPYVKCEYSVPGAAGVSVMQECIMPESYKNSQIDYKQNVDKNYNPDSVQSVNTDWKALFCPVAKKIYIDRTIPAENAKYTDIYSGEYRIQPPGPIVCPPEKVCPAPAPIAAPTPAPAPPRPAPTPAPAPPPPPPPPPPPTITLPPVVDRPGRRIAGEGQDVTVPPNTTVYYGTETRFVSKQKSGNFRVDNNEFGDPAPGIQKSLYLAVRPLGDERQTIKVPPNTTVYFGTANTYRSKVVSGEFIATNEFFGGDPVPGIIKKVFADGVSGVTNIASSLNKDTLNQGEQLRNACLTSRSGRYRLCQQDDGNTVVYDGPNNNNPRWSHGRGGPPGTYLEVQGDGNMVTYTPSRSATWSTSTYGRGSGPFRATMQDDGNFVLYDSRNVPTWASIGGITGRR